MESQSPFVPVLSGRQSKTLVEAPRSVFQQLSLQHQQALASHREAVTQHQQLVRDSISGGEQNFYSDGYSRDTYITEVVNTARCRGGGPGGCEPGEAGGRAGGQQPGAGPQLQGEVGTTASDQTLHRYKCRHTRHYTSTLVRQ